MFSVWILFGHSLSGSFSFSPGAEYEPDMACALAQYHEWFTNGCSFTKYHKQDMANKWLWPHTLSQTGSWTVHKWLHFGPSWGSGYDCIFGDKMWLWVTFYIQKMRQLLKKTVVSIFQKSHFNLQRNNSCARKYTKAVIWRSLTVVFHSFKS